jgi:hypothetical protein
MGELEEVAKVIASCASETLQSLAFSELIITDDIVDNQIDQMIPVKIDILLPYLGDVWVLIHHEMAKLISLNLFQDTNEEMINDSAKEYLNIFAGLLMQKMLPNDLFELGIPAIMSIPELSSYQLIALKNENDYMMVIAHRLS